MLRSIFLQAMSEPNIIISFKPPRQRSSPEPISFSNIDFSPKRKASHIVDPRSAKRRALTPTDNETPSPTGTHTQSGPYSSIPQRVIKYLSPCAFEGDEYPKLLSLGVAENDDFSTFVRSVFAEECAFWQLNPTLFIANGWDNKRRTPTRKWYHLQRVFTQSGMSATCLCPAAKKWIDCFHERFLKEYGDNHFQNCTTNRE